MQHVDAFTANPGCCVRCLRSPAGGGVDTMVTLNAHGRVYLCAECVTEAGRLVGLVPEPEAVAAQGAVDELADQHQKLFEEHELLLQSVGHLLEQGATVRRGKIQLKRPPGAKRPLDVPR